MNQNTELGMELIKLLETENRCLQKALDLSSRYLTQLASEKELGITALDQFTEKRTHLFKTFHLLNKRLNDLTHAQLLKISPVHQKKLFPDAIQTSIRKLLSRKTQLIQNLRQKDENLISRIREEQNRLSQELSSSDRSIEKVMRFKSNWISESGRNLDGKL